MTPLPARFGLVLDRSVRMLGGGTVMVGGHPGRLMKLTGGGARALAALLDGGPAAEETRALARRLVDAGMAHPRPPRDAAAPARAEAAARTAMVVIPARDRSDSLDRCLRSLGPRAAAAVVVDDGSTAPAAVAEVCGRHGAHLVALSTNGGPASARNQGLAIAGSELIAFVDSDCTVTDGWLERVAWLFEDPLIGAVAPRVLPLRDETARRSTLTSFSARHSALDMGPDEGEVGPDRPVRYVPSAALVVRRAAMVGGFDPALQVGEDVDMVWRLLDAGWRVRYAPTSTVHHAEPTTWRSLLRRRFRYGTSAGPLAARHPGRMAPVELRPWPVAASAAALAGRFGTAVALTLGSAGLLARRLRPLDVPLTLPLRWSLQAAGWSVIGFGRAATMLAGPALLVFGVGSRRRATIATVLALGPPTVEWWRRRPDLDPVRWSAACLVDDLAYGAGVWAGCIRTRSFEPLLPAFRVGRPPASPSRNVNPIEDEHVNPIEGE